MMNNADYLTLLANQIDITTAPFSDRGSRLLVFRYPNLNSLYVKLAERLIQLDADVEAYLRRPPFIQSLVLIDQDGRDLEFELTTHPHRLKLATRLGEFNLAFQSERILSFGIPPNQRAGIRFRVFPQSWTNMGWGGRFISVRNVVYATTGEVIHNQIEPVEGGYEVQFIVQSDDDCAITVGIHPDAPPVRLIQPFSQTLSQAETRWREWFDRVPPVKERFARTYAYAWWIMACNLISPHGSVIYEAMMPSKLGYVGLWLWDNAMHTLAYRHVDAELARNQIRSMLAHQLNNGMLPDAVFDEGIVATISHPIQGDVTKPPLLAWAALKLHETDPDLDFLQEIYVPLMRVNAWWLSMNDDDGDGLIQYNHPFSSGLDDSPLWDEGMPVESPDLNTYLCIQMESLAVMAELLKMDTEAAMWRRRVKAMVQRMMKHFWDPKAGLFWAIKGHKPIRVVTPFNLYPLWTGQLSKKIVERLLTHLRNPDEFWGPFALPTVARNDPKFDSKTMWRGPIWANVNYFFIEALNKIGEHGLANDLRSRTLDLILSQPDIYEYYDAETGVPPARAINMFGWTSAVFIDLAIQASREGEEQQEKE